jgi:hypothetical protein
MSCDGLESMGAVMCPASDAAGLAAGPDELRATSARSPWRAWRRLDRHGLSRSRFAALSSIASVHLAPAGRGRRTAPAGGYAATGGVKAPLFTRTAQAMRAVVSASAMAATEEGPAGEQACCPVCRVWLAPRAGEEGYWATILLWASPALNAVIEPRMGHGFHAAVRTLRTLHWEPVRCRAGGGRMDDKQQERAGHAEGRAASSHPGCR